MLPDSGLTSACVPPGLAIARRSLGGDEQRMLIARQPFAAGDCVFVVQGVESSAINRYSLQVSETKHLGPGEPLVDAQGRDRYPWRFLNHACDANVLLRDRTLIARRAIAAGDELTLNYLASEYDMAEPFTCGCTVPSELVVDRVDRVHLIRGYRHLSPKQRAGIDDHASAHVKALAQRDEG